MISLAVIGATGAVGRECLALLDRTSSPLERVVPVASAHSAGLDLGPELGLSLPLDPVTTLTELDPESLDAAILCAGAEVSQSEAGRLAAAGVLVVDNSSAFRMRGDVPLVVPEVNPHALAERPASNLVSSPNCSTIQLVRVLAPLHALAGLEEVVLSTYQAASGGGLRGLAELAEASADFLADPKSPQEEPGRFGQPLSFNLVPEIGRTDDTGFTHEERKLTAEPRKILGLPQLRISATAVRVPVFHCHSEAVRVRLREAVSAVEVEDALAVVPGLKVYRRSDPAPAYPMPRSACVDDEDRAMVHVGRIRVDPDDPQALWLWIVADNLWVGAALNTVRTVELAVRYGWLNGGTTPR
ncbi:Aspartate-semialdehyde dehydrogenase [Actinobacteria bacterium OK074]|nr:Aspartate-semialdehyde dehydrogenase [Actinobacteria bacterium OK074]